MKTTKKKMYKIESRRCGYVLIDCEDGCVIDGFRHSFGFRCLDDVVKFILRQGDITEDQLDI